VEVDSSKRVRCKESSDVLSIFRIFSTRISGTRGASYEGIEYGETILEKTSGENGSNIHEAFGPANARFSTPFGWMWDGFPIGRVTFIWALYIDVAILTHHFDLVYLRNMSPRRRSDRLAHILSAILPLHVEDSQATVAIQGDSFGRLQLLLKAVGQEDLLSPPSHPSLRAYVAENNNLFCALEHTPPSKARHFDSTHVAWLLRTNKVRRERTRTRTGRLSSRRTSLDQMNLR